MVVGSGPPPPPTHRNEGSLESRGGCKQERKEKSPHKTLGQAGGCGGVAHMGGNREGGLEVSSGALLVLGTSYCTIRYKIWII